MVRCDMSAVVPFPRALRTTLGAIVPFRDDDILVSASVRISFIWYFIFHNHFCTCHVAIMYFFTHTRTRTRSWKAANHMYLFISPGFYLFSTVFFVLIDIILLTYIVLLFSRCSSISVFSWDEFSF